MTDINPTPSWANVRQLETNEFATGGANGNMNEQAKSLAARSELLKKYAALPYESKTGGYALNERVQLTTGDIVRSTIPSNVNNPNDDMTGWVFVSETLTTVELKLLKPTINTLYYLEDKQGYFEWVVGNYTSMISLDVNEGIYIKATFIASNTGCWKRVFSGLPFAKWFGDMTNPTNIQNAINVCKYHKGIYFDDVSIAGTTSITLDGFNDFEIKAQDTVVTGSATKPFIIKNSVNVRAYGFKHEYTGFSSGFNATLFGVESSTNIQIFENQTNTSAISTPKNCKQVQIYKNTVDLGAMQNQGVQLQGCSNVYIYLNTIKNSLIDGIKITGGVSSGVFIYNNHFENLGGFETQGDCVDCYGGGTNVVIYKNTAKNCRQLANIKKGDLSTGDAPTSKIYVGENICTDIGNLCQLWNVDHVSVVNNRLIHTTDFVPSSQISPSLIYVLHTTENIKIINNEFINVIAPTAVIYVSEGDAKKLDIVGNSVTGTATTAQYADIYITASNGNINIENNNISHAGTNLAVRVQPLTTTGQHVINIDKNKFKNGIRIDNMPTSSIVNIFENSIPSTVARPVHFAATTSAPIINICRNSWQGRAQGTTAQRPVLPTALSDVVLYAGQQYFDTTLNKPIFVKNTNPMQWVDATGTIV